MLPKNSLSHNHFDCSDVIVIWYFNSLSHFPIPCSKIRWKTRTRHFFSISNPENKRNYKWNNNEHSALAETTMYDNFFFFGTHNFISFCGIFLSNKTYKKNKNQQNNSIDKNLIEWVAVLRKFCVISLSREREKRIGWLSIRSSTPRFDWNDFIEINSISANAKLLNRAKIQNIKTCLWKSRN